MIWNFCQSTGRTTVSRPSGPRAACPTASGRPTPLSPTHWAGVILLGVAEAKDGSLYSVPLLDPEELVEEFWSIVQDPKLVSANVLRTEDVRLMRSGRNTVVAIFVPRADFRQRPVYLGSDPYRGTYYRCGGRGPPQPPGTRWRRCSKTGETTERRENSEDAGGSPASSLYPGAD